MTELPHQSYNEAPPCRDLQHAIRCYWTAQSNGQVVRKRILPDGCADLLIRFATGVPKADRGIETVQWIGTMTRATVVESTTTDIIGVRFAPGGLRALLGAPLYLLRDASVPVDALPTSWSPGIEDLMMHCVSFEARCRTIEARLMHSLHNIAALPLISLFSMLEQTRVLPTVPQLASQCGFSERTLQRRFLDCLGVSPKQHLRWLRFDRAINLLRTNGANGADIACDLLYADQSHFINDFRQFAGVSPTQWLAEAST